MSLRTQRSIQSSLLAALGLFFLSKIWTGTFFWYLSDRFLLLTLIASVGFLLIPLYLWLHRRAERWKTDDHQQGHDQPHEHEHTPLPIHRLVVVALPLLLGLLIPARPLSASAIANKELNSTAPLTAGGGAKLAEASALAPAERTVLDWVRAFNFSSQPTAFDGQSADVVGFVYRDARLPAGQFLAGRFAITHCVAEAVAIGVIVDWPQAALPENTWVRVTGSIRAATLDDKPIPMIMADSVEPVAEPARPYLYP